MSFSIKSIFVCAKNDFYYWNNVDEDIIDKYTFVYTLTPVLYV